MSSPNAALDDRHADRHWSAYGPSFFPELDCSGLHTASELEGIIERDFSAKAPRAHDINGRLDRNEYPTRFELLRDVVRYLYWAHRYFLTLYELRPCRWEDLPTDDPDARLPVVSASAVDRELTERVFTAFHMLPTQERGGDESQVLELLKAPLAAITFDPEALDTPFPTMASIEQNSLNMLMRVGGTHLSAPPVTAAGVLRLCGSTPELTALLRQSGALAATHVGRWGTPSPVCICDLAPVNLVLIARPRSAQITRLLDADRKSLKTPGHPSRRRAAPSAPAFSARAVAKLRFAPDRGVSICALSAVKGEVHITNDDIVANAAWHWSPMSSSDIAERTGILERRYTERSLDDLACEAAFGALEQIDGEPAETIGAVIACSVTNAQQIPALATRVADCLGLERLAGAYDVVAACAGMPYGLQQAARIVEEIGCSVLLVLGEKFSDKLGTVRSSRMLFGDGAAAMILSPAADGPGDVELVQTYGGGSRDELAAIVWPNPAFNNALTVEGPGARSIVERYLAEMLRDLPEATSDGALPADADLIIPHQANERMVRELTDAAGVPGDGLYFNVARVGNMSAASIPVALYDAVQEGAISGEARILTPAFGAGAVAGVALIRLRARVIGAIRKLAADDSTDDASSCNGVGRPRDACRADPVEDLMRDGPTVRRRRAASGSR